MPFHSLVSKYQFRRLVVITLTIISVMQFTILYNAGIPVRVSIADSLITNLLLTCVSMLVVNSLRFYFPAKEQLLYVVVLCLIMSLLWLGITRTVMKLVIGLLEYDYSYFRGSILLRFSFAMLILGGCGLLSVFWFTQKEQMFLEERRQANEKMAREAELYKLRQQLQPHFLFNSLNSINALIGVKPASARTMIAQLSEFLRATLKKEENHFIKLSEEIQYLQLYLDIEKVRFGHRMTTEITIDEEVLDCMVPNLILQPLVENAIKFGLYDTVEEMTINISAKITEGNYVEICISNPFDPETTDPVRGVGFGLNSVSRRLFLLFERSDLLYTSVNNNIFSSCIKIPRFYDQNDNN